MALKIKLKTSTSFRALSISLGIYISTINLNCKKPTHTTLLNWIHKIGYYELMKKKEKADDWIIIIDESIQFGKEKILVIYGIREKNIDWTHPIRFEDLVPLLIIPKEKWTGMLINEELEILKSDLGNIKYAVGDYGSDIHKGLELSNIPHIHDLTHVIALILEKLYKIDSNYLDVTIKMSEMLIKYSQTKFAHIIPPKQRKKSRYQNIKRISDWCIKILYYLENKNEIDIEIYDKLKWLLDYREFITELSELNNLITEVEKILKYNGYSENIKSKCNEILEKLNTNTGKIMKEKLSKYFDETQELLPKVDKILISSDIIESAFGKYKNYVSNNPMAGVTNLILCLSAFTASLTEIEIKKALETTTINDIVNWTKKIIGKTLLKKRNEVLLC